MLIETILKLDYMKDSLSVYGLIFITLQYIDSFCTGKLVSEVHYIIYGKDYYCKMKVDIYSCIL